MMDPILKSIDPTDALLAKLNRFTRRAHTAEEVYIFSVILCDNEVDRDHERFTVPALEKLCALFVGKTGIFDHNPKSGNQTARVFDCEVITDPARKTAGGEDYTALRATAYMVRTERTADLIAEIEAGIKKEVSISCAVAKRVCSVCGVDMRRAPCTHRPGREYGGKAACVILDEPTDAYEWSFVAVPAQRAAGVVKAHGDSAFCSAVQKLSDCRGELTLSETEAMRLHAEIDALQKQAALLDDYKKELYGDIIRLVYLASPNLPRSAVEKSLAELDIPALCALRADCLRAADFPASYTAQLADCALSQTAKNENVIYNQYKM